MSKVLKIAIFGLLLATLGGRSWAVNNAVVGTCYPGTQFSTIQSAINAADPNSTVRICYGRYPEQLIIAKPLTLLGYSTQTQVVIVPPSGGVTPNVSSPIVGSIAAQISILNAAVNLNNLAIDGGGGQCATSAQEVGILNQYGGGVWRNLAFRNGPACAGYVAFYAENSSNLMIMNNSLHECLACVRVTSGSNITVTGNTIIQGGTVPGFWGIDLEGARGTSTVTSNTVVGMQIAGILIHNTPNAKVMHNLVPENPASPGIVLDAATNAKVQYNTITNAYQGIMIDDHGVAGFNTVNMNTILDSSCGLSVGSTLNDTVTPNSVYVTAAGYCL